MRNIYIRPISGFRYITASGVRINTTFLMAGRDGGGERGEGGGSGGARTRPPANTENPRREWMNGRALRILGSGDCKVWWREEPEREKERNCSAKNESASEEEKKTSEKEGKEYARKRINKY